MTTNGHWQERFAEKVVSAEEALRSVRDGDLVVFAMGAGGEPIALGFALAGRMNQLKDVAVFHAVANAPYPWFQGGEFDVRCSYFGPMDRRYGQERQVDYVPWSYGTQNRQAERERWGAYTKPDVFLVKVAPPDEDGWCSFGHSVWYSPTCARNARTVIAEVDSSFIRPNGDEARIHVSDIEYLVEGQPLDFSRIQFPPIQEEEATAAEVIGAYSAELVEDGDTIQVGVGLASQAVLPFLESRSDLGVHSELVFTEMVELAEKGVITGARKTVDPGKVVGTCFVLWPGAERQRDAAAVIDGNPNFEFRDIGVSRIVAQSEAGAVATIPRNYVDYVVTEYGVASLQGKSLRRRAEELIGLAHPDFRGELERSGQEAILALEGARIESDRRTPARWHGRRRRGRHEGHR